MKTLPPWTDIEEAVLDRLVVLAEQRCEGDREAMISLQSKLRGTGGVAAVVMGLEINALGLLEPLGADLAMIVMAAGAVALIGSLAVATAAGRPVDEPGQGDLSVWVNSLVDCGGTRTKAALVDSLARVHELWQPALLRYARLASVAQWLLAVGVAVAAIGALLARL